MTQQTADRMLSDDELAEIEKRVAVIKQIWGRVAGGTHELNQFINGDSDALFSHIRALSLTAAPAGDVGVNEIWETACDFIMHKSSCEDDGSDTNCTCGAIKFLDELNHALQRLTAAPPASPEVVEVENLKAELEDMQQIFDMRWNADIRAIKRWQEAHPGNDLVWPDHADLVVWLMEQL